MVLSLRYTSPYFVLWDGEEFCSCTASSSSTVLDSAQKKKLAIARQMLLEWFSAQLTLLAAGSQVKISADSPDPQSCTVSSAVAGYLRELKFLLGKKNSNKVLRSAGYPCSSYQNEPQLLRNVSYFILIPNGDCWMQSCCRNWALYVLTNSPALL